MSKLVPYNETSFERKTSFNDNEIIKCLESQVQKRIPKSLYDLLSVNNIYIKHINRDTLKSLQFLPFGSKLPRKDGISRYPICGLVLRFSNGSALIKTMRFEEELSSYVFDDGFHSVGKTGIFNEHALNYKLVYIVRDPFQALAIESNGYNASAYVSQSNIKEYFRILAKIRDEKKEMPKIIIDSKIKLSSDYEEIFSTFLFNGCELV